MPREREVSQDDNSQTGDVQEHTQEGQQTCAVNSTSVDFLVNRVLESFLQFQMGSNLQYSAVRSNSEPEFNAKGHPPRSDVFLVTVRFTRPPEVPPGKGFVESSRPSSSVQELDLLGYSLCCYCFICLYLLLLVL